MHWWYLMLGSLNVEAALMNILLDEELCALAPPATEQLPKGLVYRLLMSFYERNKSSKQWNDLLNCSLLCYQRLWVDIAYIGQIFVVLMCWLALYACDNMRWKNCWRVQLPRHVKMDQGHFDNSLKHIFKIARNGTVTEGSDKKYDAYLL